MRSWRPRPSGGWATRMVRGLPSLLPEPKQPQRLPGVLRLSSRLPIVLNEGSADDGEPGRLYRSFGEA